MSVCRVDQVTVNVKLVSYLNLPAPEDIPEDTKGYAANNPELVHRVRSRRASVAGRKNVRRVSGSSHTSDPP